MISVDNKPVGDNEVTSPGPAKKTEETVVEKSAEEATPVAEEDTKGEDTKENTAEEPKEEDKPDAHKDPEVKSDEEKEESTEKATEKTDAPVVESGKKRPSPTKDADESSKKVKDDAAVVSKDGAEVVTQ